MLTPIYTRIPGELLGCVRYYSQLISQWEERFFFFTNRLEGGRSRLARFVGPKPIKHQRSIGPAHYSFVQRKKLRSEGRMFGLRTQRLG